MGLQNVFSPDSSFNRLRRAVQRSSLKTRLVLGLIPSVLLILSATGFFTYLVSNRFINDALARSSQLQVMALKHDIESQLDRWRQDLSVLAKEKVSVEVLIRFLERSRFVGGPEYLGVVFISQKNADHLILMAKEGNIVQIPPAMVSEIKPIPLIYYEKIKELKTGEVWLSPITAMEYPFPEPANPNQKLIRKVIHMATPYDHPDYATGYLVLTVDVFNLRNLLSVYNSRRSPIWAFERTAEERYFYLFDIEGWILFQSESPERPQGDLTTHLARSGFSGTLGRQGLESAFLPDSSFDEYWKMVEDVRAGRNRGMMLTTNKPNYYGREYFLAYAPVRFRSALQASPQVVAGLAYMDISRLTVAAGLKHMDTMLLITLLGAAGVAALIYLLGAIITRPIHLLATAVRGFQQQPELRPIQLPYLGKEIQDLQLAINTMITTVQRQVEEIHHKDRLIRSASLKEQVSLDHCAIPAGISGEDPAPAIVGYGPRIERLKADIRKAAQVDADVLIIGETGTGKQLTAEAIHQLSERGARPFISINCGALDENLLLDTLFGHVRGAFTEAKGDRKGAFLEAHQGTLFLDEIQVASQRVQQAMLRAIAVRKIKPLGSDREIDIDVRLIVASNIELQNLIQKGKFREDLYFRLKVITIHTLPLREQKENIPVLSRYFLELQERLAGREGMGLSKGALSKLMRYDWPGNVRELQNCITRAVVMAEHPVIQAEDIPLETRDWDADLGSAILPAPVDPVKPEEPAIDLSHRQRKAWGAIMAQGRITRSQYQAIIGGNLPARTAIYDLQDLVSKGVLKKAGNGPATHYVLLDTATSGQR
jgi:DNA-binding NtrC family response regulator